MEFFKKNNYLPIVLCHTFFKVGTIYKLPEKSLFTILNVIVRMYLVSMRINNNIRQ